VAPEVAAKLRRFHKRWERLSGQRLGAARWPDGTNEPSALEQLHHQLAGTALFAGENAKRVAFEFLPLAWLRTYRLFKSWVQAGHDAQGRVSLVGQMRQHGITLLASFLFLAAAVTVDYFTGPDVSIGPVYLIPCGVLALVVGRSWATIAAILCAVSITIFRDGMTGHFHSMMSGLVAWNLFMRFILFQVFVLLLDRIRLEIASNTGQPS
jgi:hypothetical protein